MPPSPIAAVSRSGPRPPAAAPSRLHLDLTVSHAAVATTPHADALVLVFWVHVRNDTSGPLHDLHLLQRGFSDGEDADLEYDTAPVVLAGPDARMEPGAGFVAVARYTARALSRARTIRNAMDVRATGADGTRVSGRTQILVSVGRDRLPFPL